MVVQDTKAAVARAEAEVQDAKAEVQDAKALAAQDPAYLPMYVSALESYVSAQESYRSAQESYRSAQETLRSAMIGLQSQAQEPGSAASVPKPPLPAFYGSPSEGINARRRMYWSARKAFIEKVFHRVVQNRVMMIRAPPQTGKTSLLQLLGERAEVGGFEKVYYMSMAGVHKHFEEHFNWWHPGVPTKELIDHETLLLVDEGQCGYCQPDLWLWSHIKRILLGGMGSKLSVVVASSVLSTDARQFPTPFNLDEKSVISLAGSLSLRFSDEECEELWHAFCKFTDFKPKDASILSYIKSFTDQQPGLMTHVLDWLVFEKFHDKHHHDNEDVARKLLSSSKLTYSLHRIRSITGFADKIRVDRDYAATINMLLASNHPLGRTPYEDLKPDVAEDLVRGGRLVLISGHAQSYVEFPSTLHRHYYASATAKGTLSIEEVMSMEVEELVERIISCMRSDWLDASKSRDSMEGTVYELHYQDGFYRAYTGLFGRVISPDFGRLYGVNGAVAYYSEDLNICFELLRDFINLQEHLQRGQKGGRYHGLIGQGMRYVVINMDGTGKAWDDAFLFKMCKDYPGLIHALFSKDCKTARMFPSGRTIHLRLE